MFEGILAEVEQQAQKNAGLAGRTDTATALLAVADALLLQTKVAAISAQAGVDKANQMTEQLMAAIKEAAEM